MRKLIVFITLVLLPVFSGADGLKDDLNRMCQNLKRCSMEQMAASQNITEEMKSMMEAVFDNTCASIEQNYRSGISAFPEHHKAAEACVNSMANANCQTLMDSQSKSRECEEYERVTKKGIN